MVIDKTMEPNANHVVSSMNLSNEDRNEEKQFNPSILGREFVRQYYTMLNEGPHNLYRFYGVNSSLIHGNEPGEVVQPAYGQFDINKKLMSLNFKDCHTKIRQVDSLETTNKSVVVQVIGELSNNGQPMRRFFQTFILSPRSPTHYYVRNDIFRYQDEVFVDEDEGYTENLDDGNHVIDNAALDPQTAVLSSSLVINNLGQQTKNDKLNGQLTDQDDLNSADLDERKNKFACMNPAISPINTVTDTIEEDQLNRSVSEQSIDSSTINDNDKQTSTNDDEDEQKKVESDQQSAESSVQQEKSPPVQETRTYATMVQRKFSYLNSPLLIKSTDKRDDLLIKSNEESLVNTVLNNNKKDSDDFLRNDWNEETVELGSDSCQVGRLTPTNTNTATAPYHLNKPQRNGGGNQLPDEHQVFVGNLPSSITEDQLREYFIKYGEIVDVRICQKNGKTPNYGFITFNKALAVDEILSKKPLYFNNHRINVEEKKSIRGFPHSSSTGFSRKDKDHLSNRNFNSSTGSNNHLSTFCYNNTSRPKEDRNRGSKDKDRKSTNSTNTGNRNSNSNFSRR